MSDASERLRRLLFLVPYLARRRSVPVDELARATGVTRAELLRDLELLPMVGRPPFTPADYLDLSVEDDQVTLTLDQRFSRPPRLTAPEAAGLAAAAAALEPGRGDALHRALRKLEEALPPHARAAYGTLASRLATSSDEAMQDLLRPLAEAGVRRLEVVIEYLSAAGARAQRRSVQPWRVLAHRGQWYLYGFDIAKKAERLFRVDRMTRVTQTEKRFERPRAIAKPGEELWPRGSRAAPGQPVLRFSRRVAAIALERFPREAVRERDGSVRVELAGATHEWVVSLALTHAGDVEVLSPPALRSAVREAARRALGRYES